VVSVIGPSGSGKTTLIRLLNGLEQIDNGEIRSTASRLFTSIARGAEPRFMENAQHRLNIGMVSRVLTCSPSDGFGNLLLAPRYHRLARKPN
jgi:polar amino acid transport system permease protein